MRDSVKAFVYAKSSGKKYFALPIPTDMSSISGLRFKVEVDGNTITYEGVKL